VHRLHRDLPAWVGILMSISSAIHAAEDRARHTFGQDVEFLRQHVALVLLGADQDGPRVAVVPAYQGRVMTSTAGGTADASYGWINYALVASGQVSPHINAYGGEERFWLGPEGGQFGLFFPPGSEFTPDNWQTPAVIDTEPFALVDRGDTSVRFRREARLTNYARTVFDVRIERTVALLSREDAEKSLRCTLGQSRMVGYRTTNRLTNIGARDWRKETGLLSMWMLGMYKPGPATTVVIPFRRGDEGALGPIVNDAYFGKPPAERLKIGDGILYFSGDGQHRSKIGLAPRRALGVCGSWDPRQGVLTIVRYDPPDEGVTDYVNSMWEHQAEPYGGDVVNSYNDGPMAPGAKPLGPFYELETSSPALALARGESAEHSQETYHFEGDRAALNAVARTVLSVSLDQIEVALE